MDLMHDWKALNEVLFQQQILKTSSSSLILLESGDQIKDGVVSNGRFFTDTGATDVLTNKDHLDDLSAKYGVDQAIMIPKNELDQYIVEAAALGSNYYQQLQSIRERVLNHVTSAKAVAAKSGSASTQSEFIVSRKHFILEFFSSRLKWLMPRRFNVLLFVDQRPAYAIEGTVPFSYRAILLQYHRGKLDQFFEPDFSSLHEKRLMNWQNESRDIGQYLESRYILPCTGVFIFKEDWERCLSRTQEQEHSHLEALKPWAQFVKALDENHSRLYPLGFLTKTLLAALRIIVYFGRL